MASPESIDGGGRSVLNQRLGIWLLVVLALAPVPFGGNEPVLWASYAAVAGFTLAAYGALLAATGQGLSVSLKSMPVETVLWVAFGLAIVAQVLPIDSAVSTLAGVTVTQPQLSVAPGMTTLMLLNTLGYGLAVFLSAQVGYRSDRAGWFLAGLLVIVTAFALWGLLSLYVFGDTILGLPKWAYPGSATSTFVNRNSYATFLALGFVVGLGLLGAALTNTLNEESGLRGAGLSVAAYGAALAVILAALLSTNSRMGLVAGLAGGVLCVALAVARLSRRSGLFWLMLAGSAAVIALLLPFGLGTLDRLGSQEVAIDARWDLYRQVLELIGLRPWTGYGAGSFQFAFPLVHHAPVSFDLSWNKAHSMYLTLWSDMGLIAGSIPMLVIALILLRLGLAYRRRVKVSPQNLAGIGCIAVVAVHSTVDFSLEIPAVTCLFCAILGVALGGAVSQARHSHA